MLPALVSVVMCIPPPDQSTCMCSDSDASLYDRLAAQSSSDFTAVRLKKGLRHCDSVRRRRCAVLLLLVPIDHGGPGLAADLPSRSPKVKVPTLREDAAASAGKRLRAAAARCGSQY